MSSKKKPKAKPTPKAKPAPAPKKPVRRPHEILKPKHPTLDKLNQLDALVPAPPVKLGGKASGRMAGILDTKTKEQQAIEECGVWYNKLKDDKYFTQTVATMIGLRRMYAVAYRSLQERLEAVTAEYAAKGETVPPMLGDFVVQFAMYQASRPFDEHAVMQGAADTVLPWLAETIDQHAAEDAKEAREDVVAENEKRRATPVPIGFKHTPTLEEPTLDRTSTLVLVGWRNAVLWLLDQITNSALIEIEDAALTILRFTATPPRVKEQQARLLRFGPNVWHGAANSDRAWAVMIGVNIANVLGSPIDLVVVDSLGDAYTKGFVGRPAAANAGDAHKRLRNWCTNMGTALIAGLPLPDRALPREFGAEYENLKTFALLRPVQVIDGAEHAMPDHYRLIVGTSATVFDVLKSTLDGYGSSILTPAGVAL